MTSLLAESFYTPGRGGHAPGDLRKAFIEAVNAFEAWNPREPEPTVEVREQQIPISRIFGLLWNCSDTLPGEVRIHVADLDPHGEIRMTYSAAARWLKAQVVSEYRPASSS